jgi:protease-4
MGVVREDVATGPASTMFSSLQPFNEDQWSALDQWLDEVYEDFTRKAAEDRDMAWETLEPLARGRVWTGADAAARGLVDELGGRRRALELACELADLDPERVRHVVVPHVAWLDRLKPAESTASPTSVGVLPGGLLADVRGLTESVGGPEDVLAGLGHLLFDGLAGRGVLSMPVVPRIS